jgi:hypothetical protein
MPPGSFGTRVHAVRLERLDEQQWRVTIDEHPLSPRFLSEREARDAVAAEVVRLDAVALALLRRTRSGLTQPVLSNARVRKTRREDGANPRRDSLQAIVLLGVPRRAHRPAKRRCAA